MTGRPAIVVIAYNRPHALRGLLHTVSAAAYPDGQTTLVISIDHSDNREVQRLAAEFNWPYGEKRVIKHTSRQGLYKHVLSCGDLALEYGSLIVLEDDLEVSPAFYQYALKVLGVYANEPTLAGFSLYAYQLAETTLKPVYRVQDDHDIFLMKYPSSWGQMFTAEQWQGFRGWLGNEAGNRQVALPPFVQSWGAGSWKKEYLRYLIDRDKYFLYPQKSYTTNMGYQGANFSMDLKIFRVPLARDTKNLKLPEFFRTMRYDEYFEADPGVISAKLGKKIDVMDVYGVRPLDVQDVGTVLTSRPPVNVGEKIEAHDVLLTPPETQLYLCQTTDIEQKKVIPRVEEVALSMALANGELNDTFAAKQSFLLSYKFRNYLTVLSKKLGF